VARGFFSKLLGLFDEFSTGFEIVEPRKVKME
jgi:hypothetical protein